MLYKPKEVVQLLGLDCPERLLRWGRGDLVLPQPNLRMSRRQLTCGNGV
jgi:hypothetical protein